jgi:hypothetical protein
VSASFNSTAANLSEFFKDFVLGTEAQAATSSAVQFPAASGAKVCMQCHDGSAAKQVHLKSTDAPMQYRGQFMVGHPVGMNYSRFARKNPETYTSPVALDRRIVPKKAR